MVKILANDGIDPAGKELLQRAGFTVLSEKVEQDKLEDFINSNNVNVLLVRSATQVRKPLIEKCRSLRMIGRGGVGMDNIDVEFARHQGLEVINTPASSSYSVAELVIAHLFTCVRSLHDSNRKMPSEGAKRFNELKKKYGGGIEVRGKTIGIIGFGRIGQAVAKYALGLGMKVLPFDPFLESAQIDVALFNNDHLKVEVPIVDMELVLRESDFITLHVPGGEIIGEKELAKTRKGVGIINAARGGVVNEEALIAALDSGHVAFAALDVFDNEPTPSERILKHDKISLSPHIGAATAEAQERIGIELSEKIIEYFEQHKQ